MTQAVRVTLPDRTLEVDGRLERPSDARLLYVMAHSAGAGMDHPFMGAMADRLAQHGVATLRYQFPYMQAGRRRPDPPHLLEATVRAAVKAASRSAPDLPLIAGGKSLGGRMTSSAASADPLPDVRGLVFLGFPLHPRGRPGTSRAKHLASLRLPMLFLQGTRDALAEPELLRRVCAGLEPRATLHLVEGADHSFRVPERSGRTGEEVLAELATRIAAWWRKVAGRGGRAHA